MLSEMVLGAESSRALMATSALAVISPALSIAQSVPQFVRVARSGATGVSMPTWMLLLVLSELWGIYGAFASVTAEVATNVPCGLLALAIVVVVARRRAVVCKTLVIAGVLSMAVAAVALACLLIDRRDIEADIAVAGSLAIYVPQFARALGRCDLDGISPGTWVLACLSAISWGAYGLLLHKLPVYLPSVVMLPLAVVILVRTVRAHARPVGSMLTSRDLGSS